MNEYIIENWSILLLVLVFGLIIGIVIKKPAKKLILKFHTKALLMKDYWKFVLPFFTITVIAYVLTIRLSDEVHLNLYVSVLSHFVALVFSIFVGYFAFLQVFENRLDKYKEQGYKCIKDKSFARAKGYYEKAHTIDPTDFPALCNLLEIYLMLGEYSKFNEKIAILEKEAIAPQEETIAHYLKITKYLFQEDLGEAKSLLSDLVSMVKDKPESLVAFSWDFSDIVQAEPYKKLEGDCKKTIDNLRKYLNKSIGEEQKNAFEKGDYTLSKVIATKSND